MKDEVKSRVIRIQGDTLCGFLGYPPETKLDIELIKQIANSKPNDIITIDGRNVTITMRMIGVAGILADKICS